MQNQVEDQHEPITTRVLIIDDAAAVRRALGYALGIHEAIEVSATAPDGLAGIEAIEADRPDVVLLDLEMPVLDGLSALAVIRQRWPDLPVVVFSTTTRRGTDATARALTSGAAAALPKPAAASPDEVVALVHGELVPVLIAVARRARTASRGAVPGPFAARDQTTSPVLAVVIGTSTGGPFALAQVLSDLGRVEVPVLIAQHMPEGFTKPLARHLAERSGLDVAEATAGEPLQPGAVRIAPGGRHLLVDEVGGRWVTRLSDAPAVHHCRPAVDPLFASAARVIGSGTLGVVMTGMGRDGTAGSGEVVAAGGEVIVQDEASSVVWAMPGSVAGAGHASAIVPLDRLGSAIRERTRSRQTAGTASPR